MAESNGFLRQSNQTKPPTILPLFAALDSANPTHSQNPDSATQSFVMERGPRYKAYAELRESMLRMKAQNLQPNPQESESKPLTPPKKQVRFQGSFPSAIGGIRKGSSSLAQSVPNFSATLRKENRKPATALPSMTPPQSSSKNNSQLNGVGSKSVGSKSSSAWEKKSGGLMARKSYTNLEELKGFSSTAAKAINNENMGGRNGRGVGKTVLGYRRY